jgi:Flp pilus assembly pilin Flp
MAAGLQRRQEDRLMMVAIWEALRAHAERVTRTEDGQDMIEYALLAALVSVIAVAAIALIGPYLKDMFQDVVNAFGMT